MKKMTSLFLTAVISLLSFVPAMAQEFAAGGNVVQQIKEQEQLLAKIYMAADTAAASRIYAFEYVQTFGVPARTTNRNNVLAGLRTRPVSGITIHSLTLDVADVQHYGNTAVARGSFMQKSSDKNGKSTDQGGLFTHVWVKGAGGWQLVSSHNSPK